MQNLRTRSFHFPWQLLFLLWLVSCAPSIPPSITSTLEKVLPMTRGLGVKGKPEKFWATRYVLVHQHLFAYTQDETAGLLVVDGNPAAWRFMIVVGGSESGGIDVSALQFERPLTRVFTVRNEVQPLSTQQVEGYIFRDGPFRDMTVLFESLQGKIMEVSLSTAQYVSAISRTPPREDPNSSNNRNLAALHDPFFYYWKDQKYFCQAAFVTCEP